MARTKAVTYAENTVAVINSNEYTTLQAAVDVANAGDTILLVKNTTESITIAEDKNITINVQSFTLTNTENNHTIINNGTVTVIGAGTIDNVSNDCAAFYNNGTATLTGNTYTRSLENGTSATEDGANSYYTILNHGTITINDGTTVTQNGKFSSLVENGWYDGTKNTKGTESVMTIEGGTFTGGLNTIKNDDYGKLIINNGKFTNMAQSALLNWNDATITNGTFTADETSQSVVINGYLATETNMDKGSLNIQGGTYSVGSTEAKAAGVTAISLMGQTEHCGTISISGGTINGDIKTDAGTAKGGSLTVSDTATIKGQISNSKFDVININGGTIKQGIVNNGPGTINVTSGTVEGGIANASTGYTYISGGTIKGGVTQTLPTAVTQISGGTFEKIPSGEDISQFLTSDVKIDEDGQVVPKTAPTITLTGLPTAIQVGQQVNYEVTVTSAGDYAGTSVEGQIIYAQDTLDRASGALSIEYEESGLWKPLTEDRFGPRDGFPLTAGITSKFRLTANQTGTINATINIVDKENDNAVLTSVSTGVITVSEEAPMPANSWYYTVTEDGITLQGLATRFNIPVKKLMADNNIDTYRPLVIGEQILIVDSGEEKIVPHTDCWIP